MLRKNSLRSIIYGLWVVVLSISFWLLIASPPTVEAAIPKYITYQGKLTDSDDNPLSGDYQITFRLYSASTGGTALWTEAHTVTVTNGIFNVILGQTTAFPSSLDFNSSYWLSIQVGTDSEMTPRQRLTAIGYAINADTIDALDSGQFLRSDADDTMAGTLTFSGDNTDITTEGNDDLTINPAGTGNIILNIDSASTGFRITDGTTNWVTIGDDGNFTFVSDNSTDMLNIQVGNLKVGDGSPTQSLDGEDVYIEGDLEVDGSVNIETNLNVEGNANIEGNLTVEGTLTGGNQSLENLTLTGYFDQDYTGTSYDAVNINYNPASGTYDAVDITYGSAGGTGAALKVTQSGTGNIAEFYDGSSAVLTIADGTNVTIAHDTGTDLTNITTGNLKIGDGTADVTLDGEDLYVEGTLEVDGASRLDSNLDINLNAQGGAVTLDKTVTTADGDSITENDFTITRTLTKPGTGSSATWAGAVLKVENAANAGTGGTLTDNTVGLIVSQANTGDIFELQDAGTAVFQVQDGGDTLIGASQNFNNTSNDADLYVLGNLEVDGTIYGDLSSTASDISGTKSLVFTIDSDNSGASVADGAGIAFEGGTGTDVTLKYATATGERSGYTNRHCI
jgi:cytoskeletal protein CcmA (bactofilin family)